MSVILEYNSPKGKALLNQSKPVTDIELQVVPHVKEARRLRDVYKAVGIAAPQMSLPFQWYLNNNDEIIINPKIVETSGLVSIVEGCLSFPRRWYEVARFPEITVEYLTLENVETQASYSGMDAFVAQHEIDHLNGILLPDVGERRYV